MERKKAEVQIGRFSNGDGRKVRGRLGGPPKVALFVLLVVGLLLAMAAPALAAGGSYSIDFTAADPEINHAPYLPTYDKASPVDPAPSNPYVPDPNVEIYNGITHMWFGQAADPLANAVFGDPKDAVESIMPYYMALGQIVPFEFEISVTGSVAPEDGKIQFTAEWLCKVTNGGDFGFDPRWGVVAAFVDTADAARRPLNLSPGDDYPTVTDLSWTLVDKGKKTERIVGTVEVSGLQDGDVAVVEVWLVLKGSIDSSIGGNVHTALVSASTVPPAGSTPQTINVGKQTVPLLQAGTFYDAAVDLQVVKSDDPDPVVAGSTLTYTINVTNLSTTNVANQVVAYDDLDIDAHFLSADWVSGGTAMTDPTHDGSFWGGKVTWNIGALEQGESAVATVTVYVNVDYVEYDSRPAPYSEDYGPSSTPIVKGQTFGTYNGTNIGYDMVNKVWVETISSDSNSANNTDYEPTNILPLPITAAVLKSFEVYAEKGRTVIAWETLSEVGTVGFYVERKTTDGSWVRVDKKLTPAASLESLGGVGGGVYALTDQATKAKTWASYRLVEKEADQLKIIASWEGKIDKQMRAGKAAAAVSKGAKKVRITNLSVQETPVKVMAPQVVLETTRAQMLRIEVSKPGLYVIKTTDIEALLGIPAATVQQMIASGGFRLSNMGNTVSYVAGTDGLYFYGQEIDSLYASRNVYFLTEGSGSLMSTAADVKTKRSVRATKRTVGTSFVDTAHFEIDRFSRQDLVHQTDMDFWFWQACGAEYEALKTTSMPITVNDVVPGTTAILTVNFFGLGTENVPNEHHAKVMLNGTHVGDAYGTGIAAFTATLNIPAGVLLSGANTVTVEAVLDGGLSSNLIAVDSIDVTYTRTTKAVFDQLSLKAPATASMQVTGLTSDPVWVLDATNPLDPALVSAKASAAAVTFNAAQGRTYLVAAQAGALTPDVIAATTVPGLRDARSATYVVITDISLEAAAAELVAYRTRPDQTAALVTTNEIYDEFNFGLPSPHAIKAFIAHAYANWNTRYVVLAGEGSFDYKNLAGGGDCLVPPLLMDSAYGLVVSDNLLADVRGDDGVADVAIGRLPANNATELTAVIAKIKAYESAGAARDSVVLVADNSDSAGEFAADSRALAAALDPLGLNVTQLYLQEIGKTALRTALLNGFKDGSLLVNYIGHSSWEMLASEGLLTKADVPGLVTTKPPVFTAFTCWVGNYGVPGGYDCLAESLSMKPDGGAIATFTPAASQVNKSSVELADVFMQRLFASHSPVLGDVVQTTLAAAKGKLPAATLLTYNLLGDPGLQLTW